MPYKVTDGKIKPLSFTPSEVMRRLRVDKIKFIDLQFTGLTGRFHHTTVAANMFRAEDFEIGLPKVDGSSIRGFTEIQESDLIIMPDPSTYASIPWLEKDQTARLICDVIKGSSRRDTFARDPYLAFSAIMAAGIDGVNKRSSIGDPTDEDIFKMTPRRRTELGIRQLPTSLRDACEELRSDREFLKPIFGDDTIDTILEQEINDFNEVAVRPHPHEFSMYADV